MSKLAHTFRTELMMEAWGMTYEEVKNPFANIDELDMIAKRNAEIYFKIFLCEPDDNIRNFRELLKVRKER